MTEDGLDVQMHDWKLDLEHPEKARDQPSALPPDT